MSGISSEDWRQISAMSDRVETESRNRDRASLIVEVATIRLLIEKNLITKAEAIRTITTTCNALPATFANEDVKVCIREVEAFINGHTPLHGSAIAQGIQLAERDVKDKK